MATRGISLRRLEPVRTFTANRGDCFRLVIYAEDAENMPNEVFLFEKTLVDPELNTTADHFVTVCSPYDLTVYPVDAPDGEQFPAFFRKASIDILVPSSDLATTAWEAISTAVTELVAAMKRLDVLGEVETVRCGDAYSEG